MPYQCKRLGSLLAALLISIPAFAADQTQIASPDGSVQCNVFSSDGVLRYEVSFKNKPVIEASPLSFTIDGAEFAAKASFGEIKTYRVNETYPWRGVHSTASNHCNGATIALKHGDAACT